jgi:hypothetical protein
LFDQVFLNDPQGLYSSLLYYPIENRAYDAQIRTGFPWSCLTLTTFCPFRQPQYRLSPLNPLHIFAFLGIIMNNTNSSWVMRIYPFVEWMGRHCLDSSSFLLPKPFSLIPWGVSCQRMYSSRIDRLSRIRRMFPIPWVALPQDASSLFPIIQTSLRVTLLTDCVPCLLETYFGAYRTGTLETWLGKFCNLVGSHRTKWNLPSPCLKVYQELILLLRRPSISVSFPTARSSAASFAVIKMSALTESSLT